MDIDIYSSRGLPVTRLRGNLSGETGFRGPRLPNGVYLYAVTAYGLDGKKERKTGKLVILR